MKTRRWFRLLSILAVASLTLLTSPTGQAGERAASPRTLLPYSKASGVSGPLTLVTANTMEQLTAAWAEAFRQLYPEVDLKIDRKDSSAAAAALIDGTAQLAPMSRMMDDGEIAAFEAKYGYRPTPYAVAIDALVVYVNKDNPLEGLTLDQVDAIFSKTPRYSYKNFTKWGQLDLSGDWAETAIVLYGRNAGSGTHEFFKDHALRKEDFKAGVNEQLDSASVVYRVAEDRSGIGYSGLAFATAGVRMLALANDEFSPFVAPTAENVKNRKYPLRRYLYVYVNQAPRKVLPGDKRLPATTREFLRYVHSQEGQAAVTKAGYLPVEEWIVEHALAKAK